MSDSACPRILLVDDHVLIRDALPAVIRRRVPQAEFGAAATAGEALAAVEREVWNLVVLDLGLPGGDGQFGTLRRMRELRPELPILVLSMFAEEKMGVAAIEAGASGYLSKTADRGTLAQAVADTLAGRGYCSPQLTALLEERRSRSSHGVAGLSPRELDVLLALAGGEAPKEVAARLAVGVTTVATYRTRVMAKLGLRTSADLVRFVVEQGLTRN